jgi:formylglycine-generating enzyme required for sulfatase activity
LTQEAILSKRAEAETVVLEGDVEAVSTVIEVVEGKKIKAVLIPAGEYALFGKKKEKIDSFLMMKSEVMQGIYEEVMRKKPSHFVRCGADCPVERVSWYDAIQFANALSTKHDFTLCYDISRAGISLRAECTGWRLPTELEWFYAASGGEAEAFAFSGSDAVDENAWYRGNARAQIHRVCQKKQSTFGLCDMSGNVWEWVWNTEVTEEGVDTSLRILRGGSWGNRAEKNRITSRLAYKPTTRNYAIGFRLVRNR